MSLCFLYRFDAASNKTFDTFARCPETYIGHARVAIAVAAAPICSEASKETRAKKCSRGGTIPQDSAQDLKHHLPLAELIWRKAAKEF